MTGQVKTDFIHLRLKKNGDETIKHLIEECASAGMSIGPVVKRALVEFYLSLENHSVSPELFPIVLDEERIRNESIHIRLHPNSPSDLIIKEYLEELTNTEYEKNQLVRTALLNYLGNSQQEENKLQILQYEQQIKTQQAELTFLKEQLKIKDAFIEGLLALKDYSKS